MSTLANRLRAYVDGHRLNGSPNGRELLEIADAIDSLEDAASPVSGLVDDPDPDRAQSKGAS